MRNIDTRRHNTIARHTKLTMDRANKTMTYLPDERINDTFTVDEILLHCKRSIETTPADRREFTEGYLRAINEILSIIEISDLRRFGGTVPMPMLY